LLPTIAWQAVGTAPVFALEGGVYCAGAAIDWARSLGLFSRFTDINQFNNRSAISRNLVFVPALSGLGCPHWDGSAAGMWIGMTLKTSPLDLVQAILEGIAFRTAEILEVMAKQTNLAASISIDGGLSANPYFCQFLANLLGKEIKVPAIGEITALGVAQMAMRKNLPHTPWINTPKLYSVTRAKSYERAKFVEAISRAKHWN